MSSLHNELLHPRQPFMNSALYSQSVRETCQLDACKVLPAPTCPPDSITKSTYGCAPLASACLRLLGLSDRISVPPAPTCGLHFRARICPDPVACLYRHFAPPAPIRPGRMSIHMPPACSYGHVAASPVRALPDQRCPACTGSAHAIAHTRRRRQPVDRPNPSSLGAVPHCDRWSAAADAADEGEDAADAEEDAEEDKRVTQWTRRATRVADEVDEEDEANLAEDDGSGGYGGEETQKATKRTIYEALP